MSASNSTKSELAPAEVPQLEHLLPEISAKYINAPAKLVDTMIRDDLGRLGVLLHADRCGFFRIPRGETGALMDLTHLWWKDEDDADIRAVSQGPAGPTAPGNYAYYTRKWSRGEVVQFCRLEDLPPEAEKLRQAYKKFGTKSALSVPVSVAGVTVGALLLATVHCNRKWPQEIIPTLRLFGEIIANALTRKEYEDSLMNALTEVKQLKERLEADYAYLNEEIQLEHEFGNIVGKSAVLRRTLQQVKQVAATDASVIIQGETGTGKGLVARAVHNASGRKDRPLIQVNCATLAANLIESELFGHEKGAFTGASSRRVGRFELADGTSLFLDEVGELPADLQTKLLRVLQDGEFERVGGNTTLRANVRIIAATNRDLESEVKAGRFRSDLWYRLSVFPIYLPPLRERAEDIPIFVSWFAKKHAKRLGKNPGRVSKATLRALKEYAWPGNIRELENLVERALITSTGDELRIEVPQQRNQPKTGVTLAEVEREHISAVLKETGGRIEGPRGAANRLGLNPSTLRWRIRKLKVPRSA